MKTYSKRAVWTRCVITAVVTAAAGIAVVETAYPELRARAKTLVGRKEYGPKYNSDLEDSQSMEIARQRTQEILEQRDLEMPIERQKEIMKMYHDLKIWQNMWYLGIRIQKNPCDLWMMQQIITETKPDYIIEAGTNYGGSALFWAHILDGLGLEDSRVITIDIENRHENAAKRPLWNQYVEFILSSSTDPKTVAQIGERVKGKKVLVTLDSLHVRSHVLDELRAYGPMVSPGSYLVAEDTDLDGLPVNPDYGAGPMAAVIEYLEEGGSELFEQDFGREILVLTFNPGGWLKRKGAE